MISAYLPEDFDRRKPIALIAGRPSYPDILAERIRSHGIPLKLIAFKGETSQELLDSVEPKDKAIIRVGQLGKMLNHLAKMDVSYTLMAGQISPKKLFRGLYPDYKAFMLLRSLTEKNAESIFGAICKEIESLDIKPLDARAFMDEDLAHPGMMTPGGKKIDPKSLSHGIKVAKEMARLDIGQGIVVRRGTVVAVEGFEGTNPMLKRAGELAKGKTLFVKTVKKNQDYRFDVPVFGSQTIEALVEANIKSVALESGSTIMLNKEELLREAKRKRISIYGYSNDDLVKE